MPDVKSNLSLNEEKKFFDIDQRIRMTYQELYGTYMQTKQQLDGLLSQLDIVKKKEKELRPFFENIRKEVEESFQANKDKK